MASTRLAVAASSAWAASHNPCPAVRATAPARAASSAIVARYRKHWSMLSGPKASNSSAVRGRRVGTSSGCRLSRCCEAHVPMVAKRAAPHGFDLQHHHASPVFTRGPVVACEWSSKLPCPYSDRPRSLFRPQRAVMIDEDSRKYALAQPSGRVKTRACCWRRLAGYGGSCDGSKHVLGRVK